MNGFTRYRSLGMDLLLGLDQDKVPLVLEVVVEEITCY